MILKNFSLHIVTIATSFVGYFPGDNVDNINLGGKQANSGTSRAPLDRLSDFPVDFSVSLIKRAKCPNKSWGIGAADISLRYLLLPVLSRFEPIGA